MNLLDAHDLMSSPPPPIQWAVDGLLPMGVTADIFGPPGAGKTTLLTDVALAVAGESGRWHGRACVSGPVVIVGGERTDAGALARDLHRTGRARPARGALVVPTDRNGDCPPIWKWNRLADDGAGRWELTDWGKEVTDMLIGAAPALVIVDTTISAAAGCDLQNQPQQYALGLTMRAWGKQTGAAATCSVSHTNQASSGAAVPLHDRLDYLSRSGGNGFPGALRHMGGVTKLREGEVPGIEPRDDATLFAVGFSKHNESPPTDWTHYSPAIFSQRSGRIELVADGKEVAERLKTTDKGRQAGQQANKYRAAKDGHGHGVNDYDDF